jgi:predicted enzyme related to lactoylglutathione lyase
MIVQNALASVAVRNLDTSIPWYEKLLDAKASRPMPEVGEWHFLRGGGLQVYELAERAGEGSVTLAVNDLEPEIEYLQKLGIDTSHTTSSDKVRTVMITDPDGNHIAIAEALMPGVIR